MQHNNSRIEKKKQTQVRGGGNRLKPTPAVIVASECQHTRATT